jgi:ribosome-binding protein aMBF1 (putative translation factor)
MPFDKLHDRWMRDEEYARAWAEEDPVGRVAVHVIRFRNEAEWTQEELARRMGKRQSWISRVEAGDENVTMRTLGQFAHVFGKDPSELLAPIEKKSTVKA